MIVYLARAIQAFVMYCVNGTSCSSLLIESTDSMMIHNELWLHNTVQGGGENWTAMQPQTSIAAPECDGEPAEEVSGGGGGVRRARSVRDGMTN